MKYVIYAGIAVLVVWALFCLDSPHSKLGYGETGGCGGCTGNCASCGQAAHRQAGSGEPPGDPEAVLLGETCPAKGIGSAPAVGVQPPQKARAGIAFFRHSAGKIEENGAGGYGRRIDLLYCGRGNAFMSEEACASNGRLGHCGGRRISDLLSVTMDLSNT